MTDNERRDRYAAALCRADGHDWDHIVLSYPHDAAEYLAAADAAIAVADEELDRQTKRVAAYREEIQDLREEYAEENARLHGEIEDLEWEVSTAHIRETERDNIRLLTTIERVQSYLGGLELSLEDGSSDSAWEVLFEVEAILKGSTDD